MSDEHVPESPGELANLDQYEASRRDLVGWAAARAQALATHYLVLREHSPRWLAATLTVQLAGELATTLEVVEERGD